MNLENTTKLINNVIENEFKHVQNENLESMDNLEEYDKIAKENNERYLLLKEALPEDLQKVLNKFYDTFTDGMCIEIKHYFKKGVAAGTSNLNFLRDITSGMKFY